MIAGSIRVPTPVTRKRHTDHRYYLCPQLGCMGQIAPTLQDEKKQPVYLCSQCGRKFTQTAVDQEYRLRRMRG